MSACPDVFGSLFQGSSTRDAFFGAKRSLFKWTSARTRITVIRMATLSFKVSDEEARFIRARARQEQLTVSEFLRRQSVAPSKSPAAIKRTRCPLTGVAIFEGAEDLPPLTVDSTREMLANFP